jgi:3-oxoacyl-[acyl-carrier protein] reductase
MGRLEGTTVILTGAAGGIGSSTVEHCLKYGAVVLACDKDPSNLERIKHERLHLFQMDVSGYKEVEAFFRKIRTVFPKTNCLVNNAGIYLAKNIMDYTPDQIDKVISINIKGAIYCSQLFAKYYNIKGFNGSIVNISSVSGHEGSSDAIYGLSKSAMFGLTKSCAMNFSPNIRVNSVAPGMVETNMMKKIPGRRVQEYRKSELLNKPISPVDVANTIVFLLSQESSNYTGSIFDLNNGCYLR